MDDEQLPAVYVKKDYKRIRTDDGFFIDGRRPLKMRKEDGYIPPRSLFDRPSPALLKMRKDLKLQRNRGLIRSMPMANFKQQVPLKPLVEPEGMPDWLIFEDRAILNVIQNLQGLPLNLLIISPGHTPNWDLVADILNQSSRTYRSPKQCRWRYEAVILPREEGKILESPKKQKKNKTLLKNTSLKNTRAPKTAQLYQNDNNASFLKLAKLKFDSVKSAMTKKIPVVKKYMGNTPLNQKHLQVLNELGITNYDSTPSPLDIAQRCYDRLLQERNMSQQKIEQAQQQQHQIKVQAKPHSAQLLPSDQLSPMHIQQQSPIPQASSQSQPIGTISQQATIVVQPGTGIVSSQQNQQQQITTLVHGSQIPQLQAQRIQTQTINLTPSGTNQSQQQIMKAIVASPGGQQTTLLTGIIPQIHINPQSIQNSQSNIIQTSSVSVVLTSPPSTVTSVQPQQIVSIQPTVATSTPIVTQAPGSGSIVQTINPQSQQVVSVSQLAIGSSSLTANPAGVVAGQGNQGTTATAIGASPQIRQRSVSKEVIFQPRAGTQNQPTVISLSGLTGQVTQLQNATLRFTSNYQANQLRAATPDQKIVASASGTKRYELVTTPQFHIYGAQQQVRQKLRFLQAAPISQTSASAQTTVVPSTAIGQTVQVQSGGGQKITVATINPSGGVTTQTSTQQAVGSAGSSDGSSSIDTQANIQGTGQVTVQVGPQQRAQFIKQGLGQNTNQKLVMLQRELPQQFKGTPLQLTTQTQLAYAPGGNLKIQQPTTQITTLIKTSAASGITTVAGTSQIGMKLSPVRASLAQNQVRQVAIPQTMTMGALQGARKTTPKAVTRIAQVSKSGLILQQKDEGKYTIQEVVRPIKSPSIFLTGNTSVGNVIPVSVSQASGARGETLQVIVKLL